MNRFKGYDILLVIILAMGLGFAFSEGIAPIIYLNAIGVLIYMFKMLLVTINKPTRRGQ